MAGKDYDGYGLFKLNRRTVKAHRVAYFISKGVFDFALVVRHT